MNIPSPRSTIDHPNYNLDCQEAIDLPVRDLVDQAVQKGWNTREVLKALKEVADAQAIAYEEDPDPEDE